MQPEELFDLAKKQDLWFAVLHKMSYPGSRTPESEVIDTRAFMKGIPTQMVDYGRNYQKIVNSGRPYFFDSRLDGLVPHIILQGSKAYLINETADKDDAHPGTWNTFKCVVGC